MKRFVLLAACALMFSIEACLPASPPTSVVPATELPTLTLIPTGPSAEPARPTSTPTSTLAPTDIAIPTDTPITQPSQTPPAISTPTSACTGPTASLVLTASAEKLQVGETVKIVAQLNNEGCVALGLPQYRLYLQSDPAALLTPENPEPIAHYLGVDPGQSDSAEFDLTAVHSGQVTLTASVSFEVHLGYPGPAYWGSSGSGEPLIITIAP